MPGLGRLNLTSQIAEYQVAKDMLEAVSPVEDSVGDWNLLQPSNDELEDLQEEPEQE